MTNFLDTKTNTDLAKGIIGCIQAAMYADGDSNDVEVSKMSNLLAGRNILNNVPVIDIFKHNSGLLMSYGIDYLLIESSKMVTEEWKNTVYAMCCELIFSDTIVGRSEKEFLWRLQKELNISDEIVNKIIDVMLILHKGRLDS